MILRTTMTVGIVLSSALCLSSCGSTEATNTPATVTQIVEEEPAASSPTDEQPTTRSEESIEEITDPNETDQLANNDKVFTAIETILTDNPSGSIVYIKRWDECKSSNPGYDLDIVVDSHVLKREVEFNSKAAQMSPAGHTAKPKQQMLITDQSGMPPSAINVPLTNGTPFIHAQYSEQEDKEVGTMNGREIIPRHQGEYGSSPMDNPNQVTPTPYEDFKGNKEDNSRTELDEDAAIIATAMKASVTASEAIEQALNQHPDSILEQAQLERDNYSVKWVIQLSKDNQQSLTELQIPAH